MWPFGPHTLVETKMSSFAFHRTYTISPFPISPNGWRARHICWTQHKKKKKETPTGLGPGSIFALCFLLFPCRIRHAVFSPLPRTFFIIRTPPSPHFPPPVRPSLKRKVTSSSLNLNWTGDLRERRRGEERRRTGVPPPPFGYLPLFPYPSRSDSCPENLPIYFLNN